MIGGTAGPQALLTPRGSAVLGATVNAHATVGFSLDNDGHHALTTGGELNVRVAGDHHHWDLGLRVGYLHWRRTWGAYLALGVDPFGGSYRDRTWFYSMNSAVEAGVVVPFVPRVQGYSMEGFSRVGLLISVRADMDNQVARQQLDGYISLNLGVGWYGIESGGPPRCERSLPRHFAAGRGRITPL